MLIENISTEPRYSVLKNTVKISLFDNFSLVAMEYDLKKKYFFMINKLLAKNVTC